MSSTQDAVGAYCPALPRRDRAAICALLTDTFSFKGPLMQFADPDSFADTMAELPFEATATDSRFIVDGDSVAHVFVWRMQAPARAAIPMCEVLRVADGRIARSDLFFDTKLSPGH